MDTWQAGLLLIGAHLSVSEMGCRAIKDFDACLVVTDNPHEIQDILSRSGSEYMFSLGSL